MDEQQTPNANAADPVEAVAAAIARLGEATAAAIAEEAGQGYSTVTARLRTLEAAGRAEKTRGDDRRTYWRLLATTPPPAIGAPTDSPLDVATVDGRTAATSSEPARAAADPDTDTGSTSTRKHSNDEDAAASTTPALPGEAAPATLGPPAPPAPAAADSPPAPAGDTTATATASVGTEPGASRATQPDSADPDGNADEPGASSTTDSPGPETTTATPARRRPAGHLAKVALSIMRAHPDTVYTVTQMTRLIDEADADHGYSNASQGAVVLALDSLAKKGEAIRLPEDKAKFKLAQQATDAAATSQTAAP